MLLYCFIVVCTPWVTIPHALVDVQSIYNGGIAVVTCNHGYVFVDEAADHTIYCQYNGEWSAIGVSCVGNST